MLALRWLEKVDSVEQSVIKAAKKLFLAQR